jgi:8-oxo-dGTP pyrophosphatase MutT (NUDIX family)
VDASRILSEQDLRRAMALPAFDGRESQRPMEPAYRGSPPPDVEREQPRDASALAYVFLGQPEGRLLLPLTLRPSHLREHGGQVALPGGRPAAGETLWETARREAREEVGLEAAGERLGSLAPVYVPVTHTALHVFVALGPDPRPLRPCEAEVDRVSCAVLDDLLDRSRRRREVRRIRGRDVEVPWFELAGLEVWGATAMALSELAERLRCAVHGGGAPVVAGGAPPVSEG